MTEHSGRTGVTTIDPTTGKKLRRYPTMDDGAIEKAVARTAEAAQDWRRVPLDDRASALGEVAGVMARRREELAHLATEEMGKPITESRAEVDKCVWGLEHVAAVAPDQLAEAPVPGDGLHAYVRFDPLGLVLAIMPWNYPYWQVVRAAASALASGNAMLLKHADNTTGCSLAVGDVFAEAGLPDHLFVPIVVEVERVASLIADRRVAAVTLTGSTRAGRAVAAAAGAALKPAVLELGGSDPFIVLEDADLDAAAACAVRSRFQNSGQACIAAKRAIVVQDVYDDFRDRVLERVGQLQVGEPRDEATTVGPIARADLRDLLARQVAESVRAGAHLLTGGHAVERDGFFYAPTVLERVPDGTPAATEELFGPVLSLFAVEDEDRAVALANSTAYGLGSNIWTADVDRGRSLAARLDAGHTAVNGMTTSDPRLPFGGTKASGYGRELGRFGLEAFVNVHTVTVP